MLGQKINHANIADLGGSSDWRVSFVIGHKRVRTTRYQGIHRVVVLEEDCIVKGRVPLVNFPVDVCAVRDQRFGETSDSIVRS